MTVSFDTLITTVYCLIDEVLQTEYPRPDRPRRGRPPRMSDAEVITLALVGHRIGNSERHLLQVIQTIDPTLFPTLLGQHAFNERVRQLRPAMARVMLAVSGRIDREQTPYELADVVIVPTVRRCRAGQSPQLAALVSGGRGGSERAWIEGVSLLLATTRDGAITGLTVGSARTEGHWLLDALYQWRCDPASAPWHPHEIPIRRTPKGPDKIIRGRVTAGRPAASGRYLVDNGFRGAHWHTHWQEIGATAVLDGGPSAPAAARTLHHTRRQRIETVNGILKQYLHLSYPQAKTIEGLLTRITAKCCMLNLGILINRLFDRQDLAIGTLMRC